MKQAWSKIPSWVRRIILYTLATAFWVALWALAAHRVGEELLLPAPSAVIARLCELILTAAFWEIVLTSLGRIVTGIVVAILLGCILAVATHFVPVLYTLFYPVITVIRATPVASFIILAYLWFQPPDMLPAFIGGLIVLPVVWANLHEALGATDRGLLEMARVFGFTPARTLKRVYLPAVMPAMAASCRTSVGLAWKAGVAAEILTVPVLSIGRVLSEAKTYLETVEMFAWTLTVILLSLALELAVMGALRVARARGRRRPVGEVSV